MSKKTKSNHDNAALPNAKHSDGSLPASRAELLRITVELESTAEYFETTVREWNGGSKPWLEMAAARRLAAKLIRAEMARQGKGTLAIWSGEGGAEIVSGRRRTVKEKCHTCGATTLRVQTFPPNE